MARETTPTPADTPPSEAPMPQDPPRTPALPEDPQVTDPTPDLGPCENPAPADLPEDSEIDPFDNGNFPV